MIDVRAGWISIQQISPGELYLGSTAESKPETNYIALLGQGNR